MIGYGIFRSFIEFFREPDAHLGLYFSFISKGQILSIPMILVGILLIYLGHLSQQKSAIAQGGKVQSKKTVKGNS
jgi:phosphatidylglycerol:prolipoprotein diacylglycerol transferase